MTASIERALADFDARARVILGMSIGRAAADLPTMRAVAATMTDPWHRELVQREVARREGLGEDG